MAQVYNKVFDEEKYKLVNPENKAIVQDYLLEIKAQKKSEGTQKQYANDLRLIEIYILDHCGNKSFTELSKRDFRNFVLHCTEEWHMSNARANRLMSSVRTLLSFLEDDDEVYGDYEISAASKIKGLPKESVREIFFLTNDVILKLWNKLMEEKRYKEATLLGILYDSGCRRNEIEQVKRASITEEGNSSNIVVGKRGKKFKVLYFRLTKEAFAKYEEARTDKDEALFPAVKGGDSSYVSLYNWVVSWRKDLKELTGEDYDINPHSFRHAYIENMVNGSHYLCTELKLGPVPIQQVKALAHHSDVSTTDSYRSNDEDREIEELLGIKL